MRKARLITGRVRDHLSYSSLMATIAVFVALGGVSVAHTGAGTVTRSFVAVNADGGVAATDHHVTSVTPFTNSEYVVVFDRDVSVSTCGWVASIGTKSTTVPAPGHIITSLRAGNSNGVLVVTYNNANPPVASDRPFQLELVCTNP